ncbi:Deoxycytidine monophosphate (dCMP) deaminase [Coemansia spiralis]|uniref:Deoxycytidylate deaminase n=2 Tax=Coemansia TaxID=4863 RepID=A0A9W8GDC8_9FUNG|nr:cytidine deaminase-like protein [Coemansia spiralis]KAJ1994151.1 Deoxycytidine monophosphate (dCMP) deaminase [Coemansia umbellata]KAJ2623549.1 Deoxycytidine monophosphate (dCMP) deaminase [Coemansia sp. RSA 1358]KAJ2680220.1 Deoxycytidine monophosphate (dCMP) deaminase [Coemansia spiralis]
MFIVIVGSKASGKEEVANYLVNSLDFTRLFLESGRGEFKRRAGTAAIGNHTGSIEEVKKGNNSNHVFKTTKDIMSFVTPRWRKNYVTTDVTSVFDISLLRKRPFVLLVGVDAPTSLRYKRYCTRNHKYDSKLTLEQFVDMDDKLLYACEEPPSAPENIDDVAADIDALTVESDSTSSISKNSSSSNQVVYLQTKTVVASYKSRARSPIIRNPFDMHELNRKRVLASANVTIVNAFPSIDRLYDYLDGLDLLNGERIRPSWDTYFMLLSELASHRANCMKRKVGCILVKDNQIIATGYNGTPKGITNCNDGGCPRCNAGTPCGVSLDHCLCIHAEENALLEAGRGRVRNAEGVVLYCNTCPCLGCAKKIVQVGVKVVVYSRGYGMDELTLKLFKEANVVVRQHTPPAVSMEIGTP